MRNAVKTLINESIDKLAWQTVPEQSVLFAKLAADTYYYVRKNLVNLPKTEDGFGKIWYNPDSETLFFNVGRVIDFNKVASWKNVLHHAPNVDHLEFDWYGEPDELEPWIPFNRFNLKQVFNKCAEDEVVNNGTQPFKAIGQAAGFTPGPVTNLMGGPSPMSATIAGGLLGAGVGYGSGWLLEKLLPERFEKDKARKRFAAIGGLGGAIPGAWWGTANYRNNEPLTGDLFKKSEFNEDSVLPTECIELNEAFNKAADWFGAKQEGAFEPVIHTNAFNQILWNPEDKFTPPELRAAAGGLVMSAGQSRGSPWVSPLDVAHIAIGAGSGWASGMLVGKTLGALAGLNVDTQKKLQEVGLWGGVLRNTIPLAFNK